MPELHWLEDQDAKRAARRVPYRLLNPVETVGDPNAGNWLIQGDNLEALKALLPFDPNSSGSRSSSTGNRSFRVSEFCRTTWSK